MKTKRILSAVLTLVLTLSTLCNMNVFAANISYPTISSSQHIEFKAQEDINVYQDTACKTRGTSNPSKKYDAYIAKNDVCYIYKISSSYLEVNYPTSSGRRTGYIKRSALFDKTAPEEYISSAKASATVKYADGNSSISKGDKVWRIDPKKEYNGYKAVIYEAKSGKRAYKIGYVTLADYEKLKKEGPTPKLDPEVINSDWQYPMTKAYVCGNDWGTYYSARSERPYHAGIDIASQKGDENVYAAADGTIVSTGKNSANGNFVVIKHTLNKKTVYSFYAHLKSYCISKGEAVSKGTKIGVFGNTGSASKGAHLHFAIVDKLNKNGGYYGYVAKFGGNKTTYPKNGTTFYNPHYVIKYNKLP